MIRIWIEEDVRVVHVIPETDLSRMRREIANIHACIDSSILAAFTTQVQSLLVRCSGVQLI